jgi:methyl-accepting chemotaxis protein
VATLDERPSGDAQAGPMAASPESEFQDPSGWGAKIHSVRFRVVAAMLGMMLAGLITAGLVTFVVQFQESDARLDQALQDRANAVVKLVQTKKKTSGDYANRTYISALHEAAEDIELRSNEVMAGIVDGRVAWTVEGNGDNALLKNTLFADAAELRNPAGASFGELNSDGRPLRTVVLPMRGVTGTFLLVGRDAADQREHNASTVQTYSLVALGMLAAAALIGGIVAGRLLDPLRRLREASRAVGPEDLTQRVEVRKGEDDVTLLAKTFYTMLEMLD